MYPITQAKGIYYIVSQANPNLVETVESVSNFVIVSTFVKDLLIVIVVLVYLSHILKKLFNGGGITAILTKLDSIETLLTKLDSIETYLKPEGNSTWREVTKKNNDSILEKLGEIEKQLNRLKSVQRYQERNANKS